MRDIDILHDLLKKQCPHRKISIGKIWPSILDQQHNALLVCLQLVRAKIA